MSASPQSATRPHPLPDASERPTKVLVLDADTPWIRPIFENLPSGWNAQFLGPRTAGWRLWRCWSAPQQLEVNRLTAQVPGWTRAYSWSTNLFAKAVRQVLATFGTPTCVVHTIPWTAGVMERFPDLAHVYRPHDYFGMYEWDQERCAALEGQFLAEAQLVLTVSEAQAKDWQHKSAAPVLPLPNGVSREFVNRLRGPGPAAPPELAGEQRPIIGCIGQISRGYDLDMIAGLADGVPEALFVFIGPMFHEDLVHRRQRDRAFDRANIRWLGPRPHNQLPDYLRHFTVCWNPLRVCHESNRRSPLRLYDYLAAEKPILSTRIDAAVAHMPFVAVGDDVGSMVSQLRALLARRDVPDLKALREYVDDQTWDNRGHTFARLVDDYCH